MYLFFTINKLPQRFMVSRYPVCSCEAPSRELRLSLFLLFSRLNPVFVFLTKKLLTLFLPALLYPSLSSPPLIKNNWLHLYSMALVNRKYSFCRTEWDRFALLQKFLGFGFCLWDTRCRCHCSEEHTIAPCLFLAQIREELLMWKASGTKQFWQGIMGLCRDLCWLFCLIYSHWSTSALPHGAEGHLLFHPYFPVYKVVQTERSKIIMYTACLRSCAHDEVLPVDL